MSTAKNKEGHPPKCRGSEKDFRDSFKLMMMNDLHFAAFNAFNQSLVAKSRYGLISWIPGSFEAGDELIINVEERSHQK